MEKAPGIAHAPPGTPLSTPDGKLFIGAKSDAFKDGNSSRLEKKQPQTQDEKNSEPEVPEGVSCPACQSEVAADVNYCPICGVDLGKLDVESALGIKIGDEDLQQYLFQGYLVKEITIIGDHTAVMKTLVPKDVNAIELSMTQKWGEKKITNSHWQSQFALENLAHGIVKFGGISLGETPEERYVYLTEKMGSHLIDILSRKWSLLNRAVSHLLQNPDALKN